MSFWLERSRRHGVAFDRAWVGAMRNIRWPHGRENREDWADILEWAKGTYCAAYEQEPGIDAPMRHLRSDEPQSLSL